MKECNDTCIYYVTDRNVDSIFLCVEKIIIMLYFSDVCEMCECLLD